MKVFVFRFHNGEEASCDASCYNSLREKCTCICGGLNHKVGFAVAKQQTRDIIMKTFKNSGLKGRLLIPDRVLQEELFE